MSENNEVAVEVKDIYKTFILPQHKNNTLKQAVVNIVRKNNKTVFNVLDGISFKVNKGDFFGIVGRNGSGKSTLLKIMAGVYEPTEGNILINGTLIPFIELGVGFNPELSGCDNVYLNGALLGFNRKQMEAMYDEIVEFAELEPFMDQKLKNYSSGMQVRLAFSIAIKARGDILIFDEVLAVGDEAFQRKCNNYFSDIKKDKSKTVIIVTHSMDAVRKYCNKAILLEDNKLKMIGDPNKIADEYYGINLVTKDKIINNKKEIDNNKPFLVAKIINKRLLSPQDTLEMEIKYKSFDNKPILAKAYIEINGCAVMATNPKLLNWNGMITSDTEDHTVIYSLELNDFNKGEYRIIALIEDIETGINTASFGYNGETVIKISNSDNSDSGGIMKNKAKMRLVK